MPDQFQCEQGDCIHISQMCNFVPDCIDLSDENCDFAECLDTEYRCDNGQCIPSKSHCDSVRDCHDGSDEILCESCKTEKAFHCDVARCIPLRLRCDKYRDCKDGADEENCVDKFYTSCQEWWENGFRTSGVYLVGKVLLGSNNNF
ncbi:very low-density lipoprotein receptor-like [Mercenaria mercenaria]|uniref:very low-density lipoprotein receptor-like n=1 Tax=Mercenaria mercenaria TaxID=6596 RepID=UPI00234F9921|nr:very low-density lipoprotein receptor-like [Mercenaria mercenaria]